MTSLADLVTLAAQPGQFDAFGDLVAACAAVVDAAGAQAVEGFPRGLQFHRVKYGR